MYPGVGASEASRDRPDTSNVPQAARCPPCRYGRDRLPPMPLSPRLDLAGLALIPDDATSALLADFSEFAAGLGDTSLVPGVDLREHTPHLTLWQSPTTAGAAEAVAHYLPDPVPAVLGELYLREPGWLFARCAIPAELHHQARRAISAHVDLQHLAEPGGGFTATELAAYRAYGYRYADAAFDPHITVARATAIPAAVEQWWNTRAAGHPVTWSRLVFAEVCPVHGTLGRVLNDAALPG